MAILLSHPDVVQFYRGTKVNENAVIYGLVATDNIISQGLFSGPNIPVENIAFVDVDLDNQDTPTVFRAFQFGGPTEHMYVEKLHY